MGKATAPCNPSFDADSVRKKSGSFATSSIQIGLAALPDPAGQSCPLGQELIQRVSPELRISLGNCLPLPHTTKSFGGAAGFPIFGPLPFETAADYRQQFVEHIVGARGIGKDAGHVVLNFQPARPASDR